MLHVLPTANLICFATNQIVAGSEKLQQKIERSSTFCIESIHVTRFTGPR